ncbi:MAG: ankyrin repeat domain-containing protein [Puniceicoccales bacterium]|nr:ankyrin repeat domain-containing protein [Puniceicoccales bacterium]
MTIQFSVGYQCVFGWLPVCYAIFFGQLSSFEFCLRAGVDVNTSDGNRRTLLILAVQSGNISMVELLLECEDIQLFARDNLKWSALDYARVGGNQKIISMIRDAERTTDEDSEGNDFKLYQAKEINNRWRMSPEKGGGRKSVHGRCSSKNGTRKK